jgi:hypothetical protein
MPLSSVVDFIESGKARAIFRRTLVVYALHVLGHTVMAAVVYELAVRRNGIALPSAAVWVGLMFVFLVPAALYLAVWILGLAWFALRPGARRST